MWSTHFQKAVEWFKKPNKKKEEVFDTPTLWSSTSSHVGFEELWTIRTNVIEMLNARGMTVSPLWTKQEFEENHYIPECIDLFHASSTYWTCMELVTTTTKSWMKPLIVKVLKSNKALEDMEVQDLQQNTLKHHSLLFITTSTKKADHHKHEFFWRKEDPQVHVLTHTLFLHRAIMEHVFQPTSFKVISQEEQKLLLDILNCSKDHFPSISFKDPMVKYLGAQQGDIIKCIEPTTSLPFYRHVQL